MSYKLEITATARQNYADIAAYILEQSGSPETAIRLIRELQAYTERLKTFPLCGALPRDRFLLISGYRYLVKGEYLTFYTVNESRKTVFIHAVFNAKKDYTRIFRTGC